MEEKNFNNFGRRRAEKTARKAAVCGAKVSACCRARFHAEALMRVTL
jgi:hypothetical protein